MSIQVGRKVRTIRAGPPLPESWLAAPGRNRGAANVGRILRLRPKRSERAFCVCPRRESRYYFPAMNFALAILTFVLFAVFIGWGIVLLMAGTPWLFIASLLVFIGLFAKYGCLSH